MLLDLSDTVDADPDTQRKRAPAWLRDTHRFLPIVPQFLLTGNIDDQYILNIDNEDQRFYLPEALWAMLEVNGFDALLLFDRFAYFEVFRPTPKAIDAVWAAAQPQLWSRERYEKRQIELQRPPSQASGQPNPGDGRASGRHETEEDKLNQEFWEYGRFVQVVQDLPNTLRNIAMCGEAKVAVLINHASRLLMNSQQISEGEAAFFGSMLKLANENNP